MKLATVMTTELADGLILSPERYDPRRTAHRAGVRLGAVARLSLQTLRPSAVTGRWRILDTRHATAGFVRCDHPPVGSLGSTKKVLTPGSVIISRLRPYLRQVGLVDTGLTADGIGLCCSTEFYVLRPVSTQSIAFLVPFLLSAPVQAALAAGQEGGHHPRFPAELLLELRIPSPRMQRRDVDSAAVETAIDELRRAHAVLRALAEE